MTYDRNKTRPHRPEMSAAGVEDAKGAQGAEAGRQAGSSLHRSAVGDRYPQSDPGNRRQGRDIGTQRAANRVLEGKRRVRRGPPPWAPAAEIRVAERIPVYPEPGRNDGYRSLLPIDIPRGFCPN